MAREIEGPGGNRHAIELENGDEESAFSAVHRPERQDSREERGGRHHGGRDYHDRGGRHQQHDDMGSGM